MPTDYIPNKAFAAQPLYRVPSVRTVARLITVARDHLTRFAARSGRNG
jgi:hypothetical protein